MKGTNWKCALTRNPRRAPFWFNENEIRVLSDFVVCKINKLKRVSDRTFCHFSSSKRFLLKRLQNSKGSLKGILDRRYRLSSVRPWKRYTYVRFSNAHPPPPTVCSVQIGDEKNIYNIIVHRGNKNGINDVPVRFKKLRARWRLDKNGRTEKNNLCSPLFHSWGYRYF